MSREMLINTIEGQECRIAVVENGLLEELYVERVSSASHVGNIYKGRVTNVEPSIQAAFVDFGLGKNGFLHISDVHPKHFPKKKQSAEPVGKKRAHHNRPPIQECLHRGDEVVVQVTKEGIGTKGPTLTTYLSIPGRLLVMMPGMSKLGVSRKIEDDEAREKARVILEELKAPEDVGFIVRTAGLGRSKRDFRRDMNYLAWLWKTISHRVKTAKAPSEIYQESDLVIRTIRDVYNNDIHRIVCDNEAVARKITDFLKVVMPRTKHAVEISQTEAGLFHDYGIEDQIESTYSRRVELKSGGSLVIDQTEALVAIDVNTGRFRQHKDAETTALKMNQEAAKEIARQLRLRDLGGVIIIDFIDMREDKNRRAVEKTFRDAIKPDRAKTKVSRVSAFGLLEMTRQRMRPSLKDSAYRRCAHCGGTGVIKSEESQALTVMRTLQRAAAVEGIATIDVAVTPSVQQYLVNQCRASLYTLENDSGKRVLVRADEDVPGDEVRLRCADARGNDVAWEELAVAQAKKGKTDAAPAEKKKPAEPSKGDGGNAKPGKGEAKTEEKPAEKADTDKKAEDKTDATADESGEAPAKKKKRRRGRRGGRKHRRKKQNAENGDENNGQSENGDGGKVEDAGDSAESDASDNGDDLKD